MQLPIVLQSAECMKAAVAYLEPHMENSDQGGKGRVVLGTVKGDVHDIGKNLVDIILTNNGYEVHNLGIKVPITDLVAKAEEVSADDIGMSGLLVKSTLIMRDNLEELNERELSSIPVMLGGAALTRSYVEHDLRQVYEGRLFYGKDAFEGLRTMDRLMDMKRTGEDDPEFGRELSGRRTSRRDGDANDVVVWKDETRTAEWMRFSFPRQTQAPFLCIADFFRPAESGETDYAAFHIVTMGGAVSEATAELFAENRYQEYLKLHGL